ncbi:hypothetical protein HG531_005157 [Fusarium graminearum]|nr:hypothetical protein HG531_005157 [Fusarium graminearum]
MLSIACCSRSEEPRRPESRTGLPTGRVGLWQLHPVWSFDADVGTWIWNALWVWVVGDVSHSNGGRPAAGSFIGREIIRYIIGIEVICSCCIGIFKASLPFVGGEVRTRWYANAVMTTKRDS